jgi:bifunctional DNA-binding transcriptional regulator/antitoxin component of YhaV-PrlF toxin-antitoxin module
VAFYARGWKRFVAGALVKMDIDEPGITLLLDESGNAKDVRTMLIKVTSKRQVTFPAAVLDALGAAPGSHLEIQPRADGFLLRARGIDRSKLAPLRGMIKKGTKTFDVEAFREQRHEPSLRD